MKRYIKRNKETLTDKYCKQFACGKRLTTTEDFMGEYCFKCSLKNKYKVMDKYTVTKSRYNNAFGTWDCSINQEIDIDKFIEFTSIAVSSRNFAYRYELYNNGKLQKTVYSDNPNLIEIL